MFSAYAPVPHMGKLPIDWCIWRPSSDGSQYPRRNRTPPDPGHTRAGSSRSFTSPRRIFRWRHPVLIWAAPLPAPVEQPELPRCARTTETL